MRPVGRRLPRSASHRLHQPDSRDQRDGGLAIPFLNIVGLLAIPVGALGIAAAAHFHVLRNMDNIAILKSLGATTRRIVTIYMGQVFCVAVAGILVGFAGARFVEAALGHVAIRYLGAAIGGGLHATTAFEIGTFSLLVALIAAWIPLSRIRHIPASLLLRRDTGEKLRLRRSIAERARFAPALLLIVSSLIVLAILQPAEPWRDRIDLLLILGFGAVSQYVIGRASTEVLYRTARGLNRRLPWFVRQAVFNLQRYRRQSQTIIGVLAGGFAFIMIALLGGRHSRAMF